MTTKQMITVTRWALVPLAAIFGMLAEIFVARPVHHLIHWIQWSSVHHLNPHMNPKDFITYYCFPYDGAIAASLFLLFGCLMAPAHRRKVAVVLLLLGSLLAWAVMPPPYRSIYFTSGQRPIIGTYLGGLATFVVLYVIYRKR